MKHFEFWHPRLFELPYYLCLLAGCARRLLPIKSLAKANYALDHGEIGIGSKVHTQFAFEQTRFLPTAALPETLTAAAKESLVADFAEQFGYPLILKSDIGSVGKGVVKVHSPADIAGRVQALRGPYLVQQFTANNVEFGVFFVRQRGVGAITGINRKHFPTVVGDGVQTLGKLAARHERFTNHWHTFLQYLDRAHVPAAGEAVQLSFIGSHTMGCKFTDDSLLLTPAVSDTVNSIFASQPGFNFGRLDVKAESVEAFQAGEFVVIEVNGVASLPTHMFDPQKSVWQAWRIFLQHGRLLLDIAAEHRQQPMPLASYREIARRAGANAAVLDEAHWELMKSDERGNEGRGQN